MIEGERIARIVSVALHVATGLLYLASPLVAPPAGVLFLAAGWLGLLVVALRLRPRRPWLLLLVPVASIAFWVGVLSVGEAAFDWTA